MKEYYLSELLELKYGKDHKTLGNGTIPCYGSGGVIRYVNNSLYEKESILIPRKGSLNNLFFINKPFWTVDTLFWSIINEKIVLPRYLFYKLKNLNLSSFNEGSAVPSLTTKTLNKISIKIHNLQLQERIISILSSLDDKIELNKKINQNLEETAQTLFKRWFIDFEFPNEEGKPYKSSDGKLIESELGEIPEGWRVGKLGEIVEINPRENLKKLEKKIYIEMKCLSETSSIISEYYEREFTGTGTKFKNKDTLMARITPCLENRKIGYVNFLKDNDIGWGSTEFNILRSQNNIPRELSYFIARSKKFLDYAISNMNGSSGRQRVSGKTLEEYNIVISSENIYKKFGKVSNTIMNQIENNRKEIEKLIELRDYLLPRLMSGEVNVSNLKISGISNSD